MPLRFQPNDDESLVSIRSHTAVSFRETSTEWTRVTGATYTVTTDDRRLFVEVNPCTITFPLASTLTYDVLIKDGAGGAFTNNINTAFTGGETCDGSSNVKITSNYGSIIIGPNPTDNGYVQTG